ncbi:MAG: ABC transporter permease [Holophagaceae bacterium]|nr:ABC transporter permease [Holophagaceae bacterium]
MAGPLGGFEGFVAKRYMTTKRTGAFVKVMVLFATAGIALGVFAMVVTMALMNGFREEIQANLFSATAHFTLGSIAGDLPDTEATLKTVRSSPGVVAASPMRFEKGLLRLPGSEAPPEALAVKAVDPATAGSTTSIFDSLAPIRIAQLKEGEVVLGRELQRRFGLRVGDTVAIAFLRLDLGLGGLQPKVAAYTVAGFFESHISEYDKGWAFIHLEDAKRLAHTDQAEMIEVRAGSIDKIDATKGALMKTLGGTFLATDLRDTNRALFAALKVEKWIFTAILSLIVLVAAFNIVASLVLLVTEKRRDLGVLLSLGATPTQVKNIFVRQGLGIGVAGTLLGLGISIPACLLVDHYRLIRLPSAVYDFITYVPLKLHAGDLALAALFPLVVAWAASHYPAKRASRVDPVDALRAD